MFQSLTQFTTCPSPISTLFAPPPGILHNLRFSFWVLQLSQEKLKTMLMQNFGGQIRCIMGVRKWQM